MATVNVDASTVRVVVENERDLKRVISVYGDYVAIINQGNGRHLLVYDAKLMLQQVVGECLNDAPQWLPRVGGAILR